LGDDILSTNHNIYSIVLEDPLDKISKISYIKRDIYYPLPFPNNFFDVFICIPLGKNALIFNHRCVFDFDTILKIFNSFSFKLEEYFVDEFTGVQRFTSNTDAKALNLNINSNTKTSKNTSQFATYNRFTKDTDCSKLAIGKYKIIIYLHFKLI
jgi:hypothetical protein